MATCVVGCCCCCCLAWRAHGCLAAVLAEWRFWLGTAILAVLSVTRLSRMAVTQVGLPVFLIDDALFRWFSRTGLSKVTKLVGPSGIGEKGLVNPGGRWSQWRSGGSVYCCQCEIHRPVVDSRV